MNPAEACIASSKNQKGKAPVNALSLAAHLSGAPARDNSNTGDRGNHRGRGGNQKCGSGPRQARHNQQSQRPAEFKGHQYRQQRKAVYHQTANKDMDEYFDRQNVSYPPILKTTLVDTEADIRIRIQPLWGT